MEGINLEMMGFVQLTELESQLIDGGGPVYDKMKGVGKWAHGVWESICDAVEDAVEALGRTASNMEPLYWPGC